MDNSQRNKEGITGEAVPEEATGKNRANHLWRMARNHLPCVLGFFAGVAVGLLIFMSKPDLFISIFSRWS